MFALFLPITVVLAAVGLDALLVDVVHGEAGKTLLAINDDFLSLVVKPAVAVLTAGEAVFAGDALLEVEIVVHAHNALRADGSLLGVEVVVAADAVLCDCGTGFARAGVIVVVVPDAAVPARKVDFRGSGGGSGPAVVFAAADAALDSVGALLAAFAAQRVVGAF